MPRFALDELAFCGYHSNQISKAALIEYRPKTSKEKNEEGKQVKMRGTQHFGRVDKNGKAFTTKHNDRNFDVNNAEHIDPTKAEQNWYWMRYEKAKNFDDCEKQFYQRHFSKAIKEQNERYAATRHYERCVSIDDYRKNPRCCPEEMLMQVGNIDTHIDAAELQHIAIEYLNWLQETYPNVKLLDVALHADEATPHIQARWVWVAHNKNGNEIVSQKKALEEMRVKCPNPSKKESRYNSRKMTYSKDCRNKFEAICAEHGIELETERLEASKTGLALLEYKRQQEYAKVAEAAARLDNLKAEREKLAAEPKYPKAEPKKKLFSAEEVVTIPKVEYDDLYLLYEWGRAWKTVQQNVNQTTSENKALKKQLEETVASLERSRQRCQSLANDVAHEQREKEKVQKRYKELCKELGMEPQKPSHGKAR